MTIRTWLSAALVVSLVSLAGAPALADTRHAAERHEAPHLDAVRIAQSRSGRASRVEPAPAPSRTKQARLEPKPPRDAAQKAGSASNTRTAKARR